MIAEIATEVLRRHPFSVIARHSRSKNGVASLAYDRAIQYSVKFQINRMGWWLLDAPLEAGHDSGEDVRGEE